MEMGVIGPAKQRPDDFVAFCLRDTRAKFKELGDKDASTVYARHPVRVDHPETFFQYGCYSKSDRRFEFHWLGRFSSDIDEERVVGERCW